MSAGKERETGKIFLRPIAEEDTPLIVRWRNNPRVRHNFVHREPFTLETHERWRKEHIGGAGDVVQWIVCEATAGGRRPVGSAYLRDIDRKAKTAEYGIFIGEDDAVGKGYGSTAAVLVCAAAREELGLKRLMLRVFCDNVPAIRSYEHAGFAVTEKRVAVKCSDGEEKDMFLMEREL